MSGQKLLILIALVLVLWILSRSITEGFTLDNLSQDRANPLALTTNPTANPAAPIGISVDAASQLRNLTSAALGGSLEGSQTLSPRIDDENSYLGLVKFCMEKGSSADAFNDPKFAENCGICTTSGIIKPFNKAFTTPTGVLVYKKDKELALDEQKRKRLPFPRVIPSLNSATCVNASLTEASQPALAITAKDARAYLKRVDCIQKGTVDGTGCGTCMPTKKLSYLDPNARINPLDLILFGEGTALVEDIQKEPQQLSLTQPLTIPLGTPKEGSTIRINIVKGSSVNGPYVFGTLKGMNANESPYYIDAFDVIEKNILTGSRPRTGMPKQFAEIPLTLVRMNPPRNATEMKLEGKIPLTFVEYGELAAFDCPNGPYVTTEGSAEMFVRDPCLRPKGQGPLKYTDDCIRSKLEENNAAQGSWYEDKPQAAVDLWKKENTTENIKTNGDFFKSFSNWLRSLTQSVGGKPPRVETDIDVAMGVKGIDIRTPCDPYLTSNEVPNRECMMYLYKNQGSLNKRVGPTYQGFEDYPVYFEEAFMNPMLNQASEAGHLNPLTPAGLTAATHAALAPGEGNPLKKVMNFYAAEWARANDKTLDLNQPNEIGGRLTSYENIYGTPIVKEAEQTVSRNAQGNVGGIVCNPVFPSSFTPQRDRVFGRNFQMRRDYTLSFKFIIKGTNDNWSNIFHLSQRGDIQAYGDRALAVWIFPNRQTKLHVKYDVENQRNYGIDTDNLPLNQQISFRIEQRGPNTTLTVNNKTYTTVNTSPRYEGNVTVWGSDPWYDSANVEVSEFCLTFL